MLRMMLLILGIIFCLNIEIVIAKSHTPEIFEGVMKIRLEGEGITNISQFVIKAGKMMMRPGDSEISTNSYPIINFETRRITFLSYKNKYYFDL